ncbi:putative MarR family transcriptional regulator [Methanocella paludicola SANAE]|uniref:MarR family transcriptional regulator n=1 Tax=Methanocella paludicola (strain DSM 17711 / JCM 13418 / NBRC 101707 / SANAE) TaxID=304371 RepID=D1YVM3_METPS|nr:winged helix DNA-binding protein [Methanocella paludicola]BAI60495.1 putative MarR family transcriptional regulator [Methanocella paludicola SANAE]
MVGKVKRDTLSLNLKKLEESPGGYLMHVAQKWEREVDNVLDGFDTTCTQIELLSCLVKLMKEGNPVTQKDIAEYLRRDKNTVSEVMRSMEKKGYITRSVSENDMRAKYILLTDKGYDLLEKAVSEIVRMDERFFTDYNENHELRKLLEKYL